MGAVNNKLTTAPFMAAATEKRRHSAITPPYFAVDDPYHQSAAAAAADLSSLAAVGASLPQDWLRSLSPHRAFSGSKWAQPSSVGNNTRAGVPLPSTSTSLSVTDSSSRSPAFNRLSPTPNKSSFPLNSMGLHDLHDRGFGRGGRQGSSTLNGLTSSSCRLETDNSTATSSSPSSAATSAAANVPHKRLRTALLADRPGALLENRTNGRAYSDVTAPWMSSSAAAVSASMTRSLVISRDIITSASAEPHGSQTSAAAIVSNEGPLPNVTVSPSTPTSSRKLSRQTDSSTVETASTAAGDGGGSPTIVKPPSTAPRLPAKKRKIDWSFSDDPPPVMPPLKDREGAKLSLPCGLDGAQRLIGTPQGSLLQSAAAGAVAPLIVDRPAVGPASGSSEANERSLAALSQSHLLLIEQARRKQSEPFLLPSSSSSASGLCLDAALHSRSPPVNTPALGDLSGTRAPASTTTTTEVPPQISTHPPVPQPPRRKLSYPNLLDHLSFNYDASLFLSQLQRQRSLEAELQGPIRGESHREEYGLRTPLVVDVSSDEPHRVKSSQECGPISRQHHQRRQKPKPPPVPDISYPRVDHLKAAVAEPTRRFSLAGNVVAPADGVKPRQHRHSSISPPQFHQFQQPPPSPLYIHHDYPQSLTRPANTSKAAVGSLSSNTGRSLLISRSLDKPTTTAVPSPLLPSQSLTPVKARPFSAPENTDSSWPASSLTTAPHTSFGYQPRNLTTALTDSTPAKSGGTETSYDATVAAAAAIAALSQSSRDPPREHFSGFQELAAASKVPIPPNEQLRTGHGPVQGTTLSSGRDSKSVEFAHHLALRGLTDEQTNYRKRSLDSLFASESRIDAVRNVPISTGAVSSISEYLAAAAAAGASQGTGVPQTDVSTVASGFPLLLFSAPSSASAAALAAETALEWGASPTSLIPVPVEIKSLPSGFLSGGKRASRRHGNDGDDDEGDDEEEDGQREAFTFISTNLPSEDSAGSGSGGSGGGGGAGDAGCRSSGQPAPQLIFPVLSSSLKSGSLKKACALGLPMLVPPNAQNLLVNKPKSV
ncbi:hypothetical protein SprV_0200948400 [Sparganum proliferum]